jgi:hypothetical protein
MKTIALFFFFICLLLILGFVVKPAGVNKHREINKINLTIK